MRQGPAHWCANRRRLRARADLRAESCPAIIKITVRSITIRPLPSASAQESGPVRLADKEASNSNVNLARVQESYGSWNLIAPMDNVSAQTLWGISIFVRRHSKNRSGFHFRAATHTPAKRGSTSLIHATVACTPRTRQVAHSQGGEAIAVPRDLQIGKSWTVGLT